ncbi:predicted protein [Sparassis crispa]|uniref:F-box domain-containing protein n=1 Tax=Sparassis crispa TaxID=139825 RepID=A0A401GSW9_9APHY|nr:predicted protein [Sparassis crispa]GBE84834.1 predicted protein [Sparassis crispa]
MHRCLQLPELLCIIFELIYTEDWDGLQTLAALSVTCRTFHDIALDVLWYWQPNIGPLVRCFPPDVWTEECDTNGMHTVSLVREPSPDDWERFLSYAARIKSLCHRTTPSRTPLWPPSCLYAMRVQEDVFGTLYRIRNGRSFLPNLRRFERTQCSKDPANDLAHLRLLLNPKVTDMAIFTMAEFDTTLAVDLDKAVEDFGNNSPSLQHLTAICPFIPNIAATTSKIILNHRSLRTVHLFQANDTYMSIEAAVHLAHLPTLEKLCIRSDKFVDTDGSLLPIHSAVSDVMFPALRLLTLYSHDLSSVRLFIESIQSTQLESLQALVLVPPTAAEVQEFTTTISARKSLQSISMSRGLGSPRFQDSYTITGDHLRPLLALKDMFDCKIQWRCPLELDNAFIKDLALAWPKIHTLELGTDWRRELDTLGVTLKGLIPLAQHCPALEHLGLVFDTDVSEIVDTYSEQRPGGGVTNGKLLLLSTGTSRIGEDMVTLGGSLSDLFPQLRHVHSAWGKKELHDAAGADEDDPDEEELQQWEQLRRLVREMGRVRRQEREWHASAAKDRPSQKRLPIVSA